IDAPEKPEEGPWDAPQDVPPSDDPALLVADKIASWAHDVLSECKALPGADRPIQPRDILILVRSRGKIFRAIIAALTRENLPVSGADRLKLTDALAVKDLLSLLRFLATEADDLALAEVLRSPLAGLTEPELYRLAHPREGTLWRALRHSPHTEITAQLTALRNQADFLRPFELLHRTLTTHGGRARLTARLGAEAEDAIDALMDLALQYDTVEAPTLTGFLEWIEATEAEVKRQLDSATNQIRVMTIHGAKGLEAPIVILPQTHDPTRGTKTPPLLASDKGVFPSIPASERPKALAPVEEDRKARALEEAWRLLYVGLTRAESWLIVCGGGPRKEDPEIEWYSAVEAAMQVVGRPDGEGYTLSHDWHLQATAPAPAQPAAPALPSWANAPGPKPPPAPEIIAPSRADGAHALSGAEGDASEEAMARGTALHALLEALAETPDLADTAAAKLLTDPLIDAAAHPALLAEARATRNAPELAWIWQADALTEVPVAGRTAALGGRILRGRIDRLITAPEIWAIDFKSNRTVPGSPDSIPEALIAQMALYHAALVEIFPGTPVHTALLWTANQSLMEIPHNIVTDWLQTNAKY
ncbi:MAG: 3'-5' exonuclease, partial [Pseudomonadota bacterium]